MSPPCLVDPLPPDLGFALLLLYGRNFTKFNQAFFFFLISNQISLKSAEERNPSLIKLCLVNGYGVMLRSGMRYDVWFWKQNMIV
jgi:hypothetical protein